MHCPKCGRQQASSDARFCRSCGVSLGSSGKRLVPETREAKADKSGFRAVEFRQGFLLTLLGLVVGFINIAIRDLGLLPAIYGKIAFMALLLSGILRMFYPYIRGSAMPSGEKGTSLPTDPLVINVQAETDPLPERLPAAQGIAVTDFDVRPLDTAEMVQPPSVTEHTTRLLHQSEELS